jgi:hypothetical protein
LENCTLIVVSVVEERAMFILARWNNMIIDARGALGRRLLHTYRVESGRLVAAKRRVAREWATYH